MDEEKCPVDEAVLRCAAFVGNKEIFCYMLNCGLNPDTHTLPAAISGGHVDIVKILNERGITTIFPMSLASFFNHDIIVDYYLSQPGHTLNDQNLIFAVVRGNLNIIKRCVEKGIQIPDYVYHISSLFNQRDILAYLEENNINYPFLHPPSFLTKIKMYTAVFIGHKVMKGIDWICHDLFKSSRY